MITSQDIYAMAAHMPPLNPVLGTSNAAQGVLAPLCGWLQSFNKPTALKRPRVAVFASADDAALQALKNPSHALNKLCLSANADLRAYDLGPHLTGDVAQSFTYGLLVVEEGVDVLLPHTTSANHLMAQQLQSALSAQPTANAFELLQQNGSVAMAALCGAMLAARMAQVPVLVDDISGVVAMQWLQALHQTAANHVFDLTTHNLFALQRAPAEYSLLLVPLLRALA
jgi:hypothetical protein